MYKEFKKITLATVKSFINQHRPHLFIRCDSRFDGMIDGISYDRNATFLPAKPDEVHNSNLGILGAWFVGQSRDRFSAFEDDQYSGIEVYNSCGSFVLAIKKGVTLNATEYKKQLPAEGKIATCRLNKEKNGVELYFNSKPPQEVLDNIKQNGFRWGKHNHCWYRADNSLSRQVASCYAEIPIEEPDETTKFLLDAIDISKFEEI